MLRYTLCVDRDCFKKFHYVAAYEGRSANKEIEQFIKCSVIEFEKNHGEIKFNDTDL